MGLFGGGSVINVASAVYNLAGDENKRPNYLEGTVVGSVLSPGNQSLGDSILGSYLNGPGIKFRNFASWAERSGYNDFIGLVTGQIQTGDSINSAQIATQLPVNPGETAIVQTATIGLANLNFWVEKWIQENNPSKIDDNWTADYVQATNTVTITYSDHSTQTFHPVGYDPSIRYLYVSYTVSKAPVVGPLVPGSKVVLGPTDPFPSTSGWTTKSYTDTPHSGNLVTTVDTHVTYSDGRPDEDSSTSSNTPYSFEETHGVYEKVTVDNPDAITRRTVTQTMYQDQVGSVVTNAPTSTTTEETLPDGTKKTTTVTTTTQSVVMERSYQIDSQTTTQQLNSDSYLFYYGQGQGNAVLDTMFARPEDMGTFFPFVPFRIDNINVEPPAYVDLHDWSKKAFKKGTNGKFDDVLKDIKNNPSIGDIDYAYAVYGVALNVKENASRQYIYEFYKALFDQTPASLGEYDRFKTQWAAADASVQAYADWMRAGGSGTPPDRIPYPPIPKYSVRVTSEGQRYLNFDMTIFWTAIQETVVNGVIGTLGTFEWEVLPTESFSQKVINNSGNVVNQGGVLGNIFGVGTTKIEHIRLKWQDSATTYRYLDIYGTWHQNMIYKGHSVNIGSNQALADADESGFIVPLHEAMYRQMSLKNSTQMSTACCFLVFNCYQEVKQKWWQSGFFQIIIVIIVVVISYFTVGTSAGLGAAALATGTALGLTGIAALVIGATVNALAAMIIMKLIGVISVAVFGDKIGAIVGAIASVIALVVGGEYVSTGSFAGAYSALTSPLTLLSLTNATLQGVGQYENVSAQETIAETQQLMAQYNSRLEEISKLWEQNIGFANPNINGMLLTDAAHQQMYPETPDSFLSRTLLTGSDIADLQSVMISEFASTSLDPSQGASI